MRKCNFREVILNIKKGETYKSTDDGYVVKTITKDEVGIKFNNNESMKHCGIHDLQMFIKVETPVSFMEAITSKKRIKVDVTELNEKYRDGCKVVLNDCWNNVYFTIDEILTMLGDGDNYRNEIILEGKWYIEQD